ncbi:MAG: thioredoxin family protein [Oscillospiraceae bacterium]|jgi:glutaredoxin
MKKITMFYLELCPYCRQARKAIAELEKDPRYSSANIEMIEESEHPDIAERYDYYYVPSMFIDGKKEYEAHPGESYEECMEAVKKVFEKALAG